MNIIKYIEQSFIQMRRAIQCAAWFRKFLTQFTNRKNAVFIVNTQPGKFSIKIFRSDIPFLRVNMRFYSFS